VTERASYVGVGVSRKGYIGVEKNQHVSSRTSRAFVHLAGSPAWRLDEYDVRKPSHDSSRLVDAATVHDDDLVKCEPCKLAQALANLCRFITGTDDRVVPGKLQMRRIKEPAWQARRVRANSDSRFAAFEREGQHPFHSLAEISWSLRPDFGAGSKLQRRRISVARHDDTRPFAGARQGEGVREECSRKASRLGRS
jgi:hypothetical protein